MFMLANLLADIAREIAAYRQAVRVYCLQGGTHLHARLVLSGQHKQHSRQIISGSDLHVVRKSFPS